MDYAVKRPPFAAVATAALTATLCTVAVFRIHLRVQTTLVGYEIGHLKNEEAKLLEERSALKMQLAKMTTQKHLLLVTEAEGPQASAEGTYALK